METALSNQQIADLFARRLASMTKAAPDGIAPSGKVWLKMRSKRWKNMTPKKVPYWAKKMAEDIGSMRVCRGALKPICGASIGLYDGVEVRVATAYSIALDDIVMQVDAAVA